MKNTQKGSWLQSKLNTSHIKKFIVQKSTTYFGKPTVYSLFYLWQPEAFQASLL